MINLPVTVLIGGVLAVFLVGTGYYQGHKSAVQDCDKRVSAMIERSRQETQEDQRRAHEAAKQLETQNAEREVIYRDIEKEVVRIVERPAYRNVCFDAVGLRAINAALAGQALDTAEPDGPVSTVDAS